LSIEVCELDIRIVAALLSTSENGFFPFLSKNKNGHEQ